MPSIDPSGLHVQRALHLRTFPAFAKLSPEALATLAEPCREKTFEEDEQVMRPGGPAQALHFIIEGRVQVLSGGEVVRSMQAREVIGGLALLTEDPDGVHAVAAEPTRTLALARADLMEVFQDHFEIRSTVIQALARTLVHRLNDKTIGPATADLRPAPPAAEGATFETSPASRLSGPHEVIFEHLQYMMRAFAFADVTVSAAADLAREADIQDAEAGATLWAQGDSAHGIWIPVQGQLRVEPEDGPVCHVGPGQATGLLDSLAFVPRWTRVIAQTAVRALVLSPDAVLDMSEQHPALAFGLLRSLARSVARTHQPADPARDSDNVRPTPQVLD